MGDLFPTSSGTGDKQFDYVITGLDPVIHAGAFRDVADPSPRHVGTF